MHFTATNCISFNFDKLSVLKTSSENDQYIIVINGKKTNYIFCEYTDYVIAVIPILVIATLLTWGLQCSSIQLKTQADSSWKLFMETEVLKDWNRESMML